MIPKVAVLRRACWCRRCMNREYGLDLQPADCVYNHYQAFCLRCEKMRNIVVNFPFSTRVQIFFRLRKRAKAEAAE